MALPPSPPPSALPRTSRWALASLILGIAGIIGGITAIPAVIFGHISLSKI